MPIDITTAGSPGWWLARLLTKLGPQAEQCALLDTYYRCENGIPVHADKAVRESFRRLMRIARTNFAELVVEAVRERMQPVGFRTGAAGDDLGDKEAWRIWQANSLDADHQLTDRASLNMGLSFMIVGGVDAEIEAPLITCEDPREVVVETDPRRRRKVLAALKVFRDDVAQLDRAYVYLPGQVWRAARAAGASDGVALDIGGWEWDSRDELPQPVVPVVPFVNRADMAGRPTGEFEPHLPILDRISYTTLQTLEIATMQAFRQRALKGGPTHDADGVEIDYNDIFSADPGAMWHLPATAELWESGQVDLGPLGKLNRDNVQDLAAVTRTPLYYLTPDSANGSAEGASLAREGLIFKVKDRLTPTGESLERAMALAFLFAGDDERAKRAGMEVIWADPERISMAEKYDAASKATAAGVPWRTVMTDVLQFSPQKVLEMESQRATDALLSAPLPDADQP